MKPLPRFAFAALPSPTWVTSVYAKRHGRWVNVLFQQTQAPAQ
jgi:hypothetical protein